MKNVLDGIGAEILWIGTKNALEKEAAKTNDAPNTNNKRKQWISDYT